MDSIRKEDLTTKGRKKEKREKERKENGRRKGRNTEHQI